jgi:predicted ribosome quality control (RQC) complex YloA/Tae2 family protein
MQPFDALTIKAVLQESRPLLVNRRVDKIVQLGRDELLLTLRAKAGMINLFMSAHTAHGRICLVKLPSSATPNDKSLSRYFPVQKPGSSNSNNFNAASGFMNVLRRHLAGASLVGVEQPTGERVVNFVFSCTDEVGSASLKILTAEIMGRHSNLIFWDKATEKILGASHLVTKEMSRQREILPGLKYVKPPAPEKSSVFAATEEDFDRQIAALTEKLGNTTAGDGGIDATKATNAADATNTANGANAAGSIDSAGTTSRPESQPKGPPPTIEQWLIDSYTGLGKHLSEELVHKSGLPSKLTRDNFDPTALKSAIWNEVKSIQEVGSFKPFMKRDLSRYTVLGWWEDASDDSKWKQFPAANDMVEEYFRLIETREQFHQLRERLRSEIKSETEKIQSRLGAADTHLVESESPLEFKKRGDLVLAHLNEIGPGQSVLVCEDLYDLEAPNKQIEIQLNSNLNASQNAQNFYRQFAKHRARQGAASMARQEATTKMNFLQKQLQALDQATVIDELRGLRDTLVPRKLENKKVAPPEAQNKKPKQRLLQLNSSDNWTIYVGRNRHENDHLLTRLAQPNDVWLHILGQGGAHVLIRVPPSKQDPPMTTLKEAALLAARMSKAGMGAKVRVVYTQVRFVKKIAADKPGLVRYEKEKTIEVDTSQPVPEYMKHVFMHQEAR